MSQEDGKNRDDDSDLPNRPEDIDKTPEPFTDQNDARPQHLDQLFEALQEAKRKGRSSDPPPTFDDASTPPAPFYSRGSFVLTLISIFLIGSVWAVMGLFSAMDTSSDSKKEDKVAESKKAGSTKSKPSKPYAMPTRPTPSRNTTARTLDRRSTTPPIQLPKRFTTPSPPPDSNNDDREREAAERERQRELERERQEELAREREEEKEFAEQPPLDDFKAQGKDDEIRDPELREDEPYEEPPVDEYGDTPLREDQGYEGGGNGEYEEEYAE